VKAAGAVLTVCRSYTVKDLSEHYVKCGHRMSAEESEKVMEIVSGKYSRNPQMETKEALKKLAWLKKRRDWATNGLYPESRQPLMEKFVAQWRPDKLCIKKEK
jgi:hypothetical protein